MGTLSLQLDTVQVEVSGYGSSTREISATRSYPNLANQDTANIPKTIQDNGRTLTLQTINWQTDNTATLDGYSLGDRFTAVATYTGSATSSYVKGYTVTADYTGTVGKINLDRVRYVAIFEGTPLQPVEEVPAAAASAGLCCWCPSAWWPWWVPWPGRRCSSGTAGNTSRWRRMKCEKKAWEICEEEFS